MLTDAEMDALLKQHEKYKEATPYVDDDSFPEEIAYMRALDAALPWFVDEIRRLRVTLAETTVRIERLQVELLEYGD
jgi:hypothetical protein